MRLRGGLIVLVLAMVIVYFLYFAKLGQKGYLQTTLDANDRIRAELTRVNMSTLESAIQLAAGAQGELPADLNAVFAARPLGKKKPGWILPASETHTG